MRFKDIGQTALKEKDIISVVDCTVATTIAPTISTTVAVTVAMMCVYFALVS